MIYFLLLISFLIHLVTFIIIKQWKKKVDAVEEAELRMKEQSRSLEDTLALYLVEIKEENAALIERLEAEQSSSRTKEPIVTNAEQPPHQETEQPDEAVETLTADYQPITEVDQVEDKLEQSLIAQALHLQDKGYTIEGIAKKLNKGKTEIELLLKFNHK
ncbi:MULTISPECIES: hypothetical protein [Gracilibacillus]|uniref:hypothetical protein n=1 Tax=Gracilibacillus TaxID=74385 RepID=UPI000824C3ED|nr:MULTISPECIES: hypothetical protein [Gracilibacillus]